MAATEKKKTVTSMGMPENVESFLCYLGAFVTGLIFYFGEKQSKLVRFHALQSIIVSIVLIVLQIIVSIIGGALWLSGIWVIWNIISIIISLGILALWIVLMVMAYTGKQFKLPIIGAIAEKNTK